FISFFLQSSVPHPALHSFPTRRSSDLPQYRSAIFYHDATQKRLAEESKAVVEKRLGRVFTDILPASEFWRAEEYHQHYYKKNPRSEEHTSELQSRSDLVCRLLLEKKKK